MRRSRKPFGLYKVTRVRIPPPPPFCLRKLPTMGAFLLSSHVQANTAEEEGFEPARARSVKKTRQRRVFSAARSAPADRINFELRSKFGHPSYSAHAPHHVQSRSKNPNMYITLQKRHFSTSLEADVHVWCLRPHPVPTVYRAIGPPGPPNMYYVRALSKPATQRTPSCPSSPL